MTNEILEKPNVRAIPSSSVRAGIGFFHSLIFCWDFKELEQKIRLLKKNAKCAANKLFFRKSCAKAFSLKDKKGLCGLEGHLSWYINVCSNISLHKGHCIFAQDQ